MIWLFAVVLGLISVAVNYLLLRFLKTLGTKNQDQRVELRWSHQAKPTIGGISFFTGLLLSVLGGLALADVVYLGDQSAIWLLLGAIAAFLMGLADDAFNTRPLLKFMVQLVCGVLAYAAGAQFGFDVPEVVNFALTIFWVVALMNSLNMLDNMDGITGSVSVVLLAVIAILLPPCALQWIVAGMAFTLAGFLRFNGPPASIFMGDSGSQLIGFILAAISLLVWNAGIDLPEADGIGFTLSLVLLFFTPLCDTAFVSFNRLRHRRSPFVGGRDHTTHNLSYLGWSDRRIAVFYVLWSMVNGVGAISLRTYEGHHLQRWYLVVTGYLLLVWISFLILSRRNLKQAKYAYHS